VENNINNEKQLMKIEEASLEKMSLEEAQKAEQLYSSAGLDPVVDAGLKDYDEHIQMENKLISKVLGPRGSDIRGYGEAVAKRVAYAVYSLMNTQYGGKMGDLRAYIMSLEDERNRANDKYDELMGRVIGILGDEYKELRADSNVFMEKLTTIMGEDIKESKIDQAALAERLADIDGLRSQIQTLTEEKKQLKQSHELQLADLKNNSDNEIADLNSQMTELDLKIQGLESEKTVLSGDLSKLREDYKQIKTAIESLAEIIASEGFGEHLRDELYDFLLQDSKVPHMVIDGVGKFIDFRKYLGIAIKRGADEASGHAKQILSELLRE
jgi:predicted  nucleic acid-binding Zn-ribbon protein